MGYEISTWSQRSFLANQAGWDGIWTCFVLRSNEDWPQREMQKTTPKKHKYIRVGRVGNMTFPGRSIQWYNYIYIYICSTSTLEDFWFGSFLACHTVETMWKSRSCQMSLDTLVVSFWNPSDLLVSWWRRGFSRFIVDLKLDATRWDP